MSPAEFIKLGDREIGYGLQRLNQVSAADQVPRSSNEVTGSADSQNIAVAADVEEQLLGLSSTAPTRQGNRL
jgi:hypothetical protein